MAVLILHEGKEIPLAEWEAMKEALKEEAEVEKLKAKSPS